MILIEKNINESSIKKGIGNPEKVDLKNPKAIGSTSFFLKSFKNKSSETESLKIDSKCNFEKYSDGLLLRTNYSNKLSAIPIKKDNIKSLKLIRGKETISPFLISPMNIVLKLGVSIRYARYFGLNGTEYAIEETRLELETDDYDMKLIANGYVFENQQAFFKSLNYGHKVILENNLAQH